MTDEAILSTLWDAKREIPFSEFSVTKIKDLDRDNQQRAQQLLRDFADKPTCPVERFRITRVGSGIYKFIGSELLPVDPKTPKGKPLPDQKESLTGEFERFSFFKRGDYSQKVDNTGNIQQLHGKLASNPKWQAKIEEIRSLSHDPEAEGIAKARLPAFTGSIRLHDGKARNTVQDGDFTHTHLIQADFDDSPDFDGLFEQLKADPHTRLVFHSPRGKVKALTKVQSVNTVEEHRSAFQAVADYCRAQGYGEIDPAPKNIAALCFISYDPQAMLKDAQPLTWELLPEQPTPSLERPTVPIEHHTTLTEWLAKHNIPIRDTRSGPTQSGGTALMLLIDCPWENQHTTDFGHKDTAVFEDPSTGKWSFNCFHAHCDGQGWEDFRAEVAPRETSTHFSTGAIALARQTLRRNH